jgi:hypothetical protein
MTTEAASAPPSRGTLHIARDWLRSGRHQAIAAFVIYLAIAIGYFGLHVLPNLGRECVCEPGPADATIFMWDMAWWPHALLHGLNPFITHALFVPDGVNLGAATSVPGAALVASPITLLFGPVVSYNVVMLVSPVLAAFFAFLLCRYVSRSFAASLVGGYLFGFSTYMLGHLLGHMHLVLIFPIPAAVHLTLRLIDGRISERRFVALMALTLAALVSFSTEVAFIFVLLGLVTLAVAFGLAPTARSRLKAAIKPIVFAGAIAAVVTSPVIYYGLKGNPAFPASLGEFGGDAIGFLVPTSLTRLGGAAFAAVSGKFTGANPSEAGTYVGIPLALIAARYAYTRSHLPSTRILVVMLAFVVVLLLGSHLHIAGYATIPLPWKFVDYSLLRGVVPARLAIYMFLIVALIAALWLSRPRAGGWGLAKWAMVAVSLAFLVPNTSSGLWHWQIPNPRFFTTDQYRTVIQRGETVLVLPWPGLSMLWQAETGMWFRMAGGYISQAPPADYLSDPLLPALYGQVKPDPAVLRSFLDRRHVGAVVVDPEFSPQWRGALASIGLKPVALGGILFYRT